MTEIIQLEISEDAFDDHYPLLVNHFDPHAGWAVGEGGGCLFSAYGPEGEFVRQQDPRCVWTFVDGDELDQFVISGMHHVNRIGYLVSKVPVADNVSIEVRISSFSEDFELGLGDDEEV
jgi:hypothetical protein